MEHKGLDLRNADLGVKIIAGGGSDASLGRGRILAADVSAGRDEESAECIET